VVHVNTERGFSGGEVQVFLLLEGLRARGVPQLLVAPPGSESARIGRERGFPVLELGLRHPFDLLSVLRLSRRLGGAARPATPVAPRGSAVSRPDWPVARP
jgi:hypothetical protein